MVKNKISTPRLRELRRIEKWVETHPDCSAREISVALAIKLTTLNGHTLVLRGLGRLVKTAHRRAGMCGSLPDTYRLAPGIAPFPAGGPVAAPKKPAPVPAPAPAAQCMDPLVAALFGPNGKAAS